VQVARMPYFSYTTALHFYESLGWWRGGGLRLVHFAEEWNELHHLLIMEALGGDRRWQDRFLGQHAAIVYYWALVLCFFVSPKWSYKFSEMLESALSRTLRSRRGAHACIRSLRM
jgi:ubiquinol oxidase